MAKFLWGLMVFLLGTAARLAYLLAVFTAAEFLLECLRAKRGVNE